MTVESIEQMYLSISMTYIKGKYSKYSKENRTTSNDSFKQIRKYNIIYSAFEYIDMHL